MNLIDKNGGSVSILCDLKAEEDADEEADELSDVEFTVMG